MRHFLQKRCQFKILDEKFLFTDFTKDPPDNGVAEI